MTIVRPRTSEDYARLIHQLMPRGAAWDFQPGGTMSSLLLALADEFARIDARALMVIEEADPRTALEMLADWERVAGLPDACVPIPESVPERHAALHYKLTRTGSQSRAAYVERARRAGFDIEIEEHRPLRAGSRVGQRSNGSDWAAVWTVHIRPTNGQEELLATTLSRAGDRVGVRLRGWGSLNIECLIQRTAPGQTIVMFAYDTEPDHAFWFDFTQ